MLQRPWADLSQGPCPQPSTGDPPVPGLPVYQGRGCPHCPYICRALAGLQDHRARKHKDQDGYWGQDGQPPAPSTDHIQTAVDEVVQAWEQAQAQAKADQAIQASQLTDANPWLRMTRWADYLQGIQAHDLLACVAAPEEDPTDAIEQAVQVIWHTMEQVARKSQQTVQQCGQAIRVEAVRSEKGQTPYRPLLAYMDEAAIKKHAPHDWASPQYGMTAWQRQKWQQLWQLTSQAAVPGDLEDLEAWAMTAMEKACLEFCIKLLNQRHCSHEYKSALVCAMAVLGQGEAGWQDPESYPPILSRVIKVA
ncbi:hypothetical protein GB937_010702 [Aspergillus fischeri]|nr:hypothetical protein GB937_010702 [Aspergillus fischeri]